MKNLSEVRDGIIRAAEKHFSLLGFEKTTLDDICGENGKCKTSVYYHFKNKHDIFKSVIEKEFDDVRKDLEAVIHRKDISRLEEMRLYLRTRLSSLQRQGAFSHFASSRYAYGSNPVSRTVSEARGKFDQWERTYLELNLRSGINDGSVPSTVSPEIFASTVMNMLKAVEIQFFSSEDKQTVSETYNGIVELIVR